MRILIIKGDDTSNVRLSKFFKCLYDYGYDIDFVGWDRKENQKSNEHLKTCHYILHGGGFGGKRLLLLYPIWMIKLFFYVLFHYDKENKLMVVNFDAALPVFLASKIKRFEYLYEIRDEFALSYNFPYFFKKIIQFIDHKIMTKASTVIHVDSNRISYKNCKTVVIENSPFDYFNGGIRQYDSLTHTFALIGNISKTRGIDQVYQFAKDNPQINFLLVGKFYDESYKKSFSKLENVEYHDYMSQMDLFPLLTKCCGIFSLYDPSLEINRLAASNKVYDAMMMGIPVITNKEVVNSKFIKEEEIGIVIDYCYNKTWSILSDKNYLNMAIKIGSKGRRLYLNKYQFPKLIEERFLPLIR